MRKYLPLLLWSLPLAFAADSDYATATDAELRARYDQLRTVELDPNQTAVVENVTLEKAGATFRFKDGKLYLLQPVAGRVAGAVFLGEGTFSLNPPDEVERKQFRRFVNGETSIEEPFKELVILATDGTLATLTSQMRLQPGAIPSQASGALSDLRHYRRNTLPVQNTEARVLAGLASKGNPVFLAEINGNKHGRLTFLYDLQSEDEAQLIHHSGSTVFDIWTAYHLPGVPAAEQRALVDTTNVKIDTTVERSKKLIGTTEVEFTSLAGGARVLQFGLVPVLRVTKIVSGGTELKFIQEDKKKDGQLWVITPKPLAKGEKCVWTFTYAGDDVVESNGNGNFYIGARTSWYPKPDVPAGVLNDRAMYRMKFHSPKDFAILGTGKQVNKAVEGKQIVTEWETEVPYTVVGFNYGDFKSKSVKEGASTVAVYANPGVNDEMEALKRSIEMSGSRGNAAGITTGGLNTTGMITAALGQSQMSVRLFTHYFGALPFENVVVSQQHSGMYGQSWPTLVFMPYTAFLDATMRNQLNLDKSRGSRHFLESVGPHEIAHQWWGHLVSWKSYRDQWLSEGFAEYSSGVYTHRVEGEKKFKQYLTLKKEEITSQLYNSSTRAIDAGPMILGYRLSWEKNPDAYNRIVYSKGAYVLHMLRMLMYDFGTQNDSQFIAMMREFVQTYRGKDASTAEFRAVVEKHLGIPMDWFFQQWVYGAEMPKISLQYSLVKNEKGAALQVTATQRGVSKEFRTIMPFTVTLGGKVATGRVSLVGETTTATMQLPAMPEAVEFNPLMAVLCDIDVKKM